MLGNSPLTRLQPPTRPFSALSIASLPTLTGLVPGARYSPPSSLLVLFPRFIREPYFSTKSRNKTELRELTLV